MKEFTIYVKKDKSSTEEKTDAVCIGAWNWWAFIFTGWRALLSGAYKVFFVGMGITWALLAVANSMSPHSDPSGFLLITTIAYHVIYGLYANRWKVSILHKRGYVEAGKVFAENATVARMTYTGEINVTPTTSPC